MRKDKLSHTLGSLSFRPKGEITLVIPKIVDYVCGISCAISPFGRNDKIGESLWKIVFLDLDLKLQIMIEKILTEYINFIRAFEVLLKDKYKSDKNPCSFSSTFFERIGSIDEIEYWFHGSGCTAKRDGIIYAYDIGGNEIQFSQWKFSEFIRTHPDYQKLNYSPEFIEYELYQLINKGILGWTVIEGIEGTSFGCVFMEYRVILEAPYVYKMV